MAETFTFALPDDLQHQDSAACPLPSAAQAAPREAIATAAEAERGGKAAAAGGHTKKSRRSSSGGSAAEAAKEEAPLEAPPQGVPAALSSVARLDTCVTVVDAATFLDNLTSIEEVADRCACPCTWLGLCVYTGDGYRRCVPGRAMCVRGPEY